jgi:signal transduction histidine kinase
MLPISEQLPPQAVRAHALKNCLAIVCAVNRLLQPELRPAAQRRLARSQHALRRMIQLIEADLEPNDARTGPDEELATSAQIFGSVKLRVQDLAETRGVELLLHAGPGAVRGVFDALSEALGNVVLNAVQATPRGGTVVVASYPCENQGQLWTVRDGGPGISWDALRNVGKPFRCPRSSGAGFGLAVARDVVARHGGLIHIESAPWSGTQVSIWLPGAAG